MTKYRIIVDNQTIEFASETEAQQYKTANNIESAIESFTEEIIESVYVPETLTSRQIRLALVLSGVSLAAIGEAIHSLPEPDRSLTQITWEYATIVERHHPMINGLGAQLSLTAQHIDDLFILGAGL